MSNKLYKVYMHTTPNGKRYIGFTGNSLKQRWGNGKHYKQHRFFYNAILKYGWDNICHELLYETDNRDDALEKEMEYIKQYKSNNRKFGYNSSIGGESGFNGGKHSKRTIDKIKKTSILTQWTIEHLSKPVAQYDLKGNLIKVYDSITQAAHATGLSRNTIIYGCSNKTTKPQKYFWEYCSKGNLCKNICINDKIKPRKDNKLITHNGKTQTIDQWAKEYNIRASTLRGRLSNRSKMTIEDALTRPLDTKKIAIKYREKLQNYGKGE